MAPPAVHPGGCLVMVRFTVDPGDQQRFLDMMLDVAPVLKRQAGFVSSTICRSDDGTELVNHLRWESRGHHEACRDSPDMAQAGRTIMGFVAIGRAAMDVQVYDALFEDKA